MCNPPFGKRLGEVDKLKDLYISLGDFMKHQAADSATGVIITNRELSKSVGLKSKKRLPVTHEGIDATIISYDLY